MYTRETFLVAALAVVPALATSSPQSSVNVYFGQNGNANLSDVCSDPSFDYVTLGFINVSPENGGASGYPKSNFAAHCWAGNYDNDGIVSGLLNTCPYLNPGVDVCQSQYGKKVLLSIGGWYDEYSNYTVSTQENGVAFADFIWGAFGPYDESWEGQPRPFDNNGVHVAVDGYDFDIESAEAGTEGYQAMIERLRHLIAQSGRPDIITGAPQCPLSAEWQPMLPLLQTAQFDRLWIQFYNNPSCELIAADGTPNAGFNYAAWAEFLAGTPSADAKLHVGLPGSAVAATSGYVDAETASSVLCGLQGDSGFGGLMLWDQTFAAANVGLDGVGYTERLAGALRCGCRECPVPTTSSTVVDPTSTTSSASESSKVSSTVESASTSSSVVVPTSTSSVEASTTSSTTNSGPAFTNTSPSLGPSGPAPSETSHTTSGSPEHTGKPSVGPSGHSSSTVTSLLPTHLPSSSYYLNWTSTAVSSAYPSSETEVPSSSESSRSVVLSTQPHTSWSNTTWTAQTSQASSTDATQSDVPTSSLSDVSSTSSSNAGVPTSSSQAGPTSTGTGPVTVTNWTTTVHTITSCAAEVTDCPAGTHYSTSSWAVTTTIGSPSSTSSVGAEQGSSSQGSASTGVSATASVTSTAEVSPTPSQAEAITSTIWSTQVHTITSCAPTVTDCPAGPHYSTTSFPVVSIIIPGTITSSGAVTTKAAVETGTPSSSVEQWTTSTIFSTTVYTVTSCTAAVTDCPAHLGSVTTEIVAVTTTVCPVTAAGASSTGVSSPVETGTTGSGDDSGSDTNSAGSSGSESGAGSSTATPSSSETVASQPGASVSESSSPSPTSLAIPEHFATESALTTSGTSTTTTHIFSTVTVAVPTSSSGAEDSTPPEAAANNAAAGAGNPAPVGSGLAHYNGTTSATATKTYSLAKVGPTGVSAAPSKSASAVSPIVTAGAGRNVGGVGLAVVVGAVALVL